MSMIEYKSEGGDTEKLGKVWRKMLLRGRRYTITCHVVFDGIPANPISITADERARHTG